MALEAWEPDLVHSKVGFSVRHLMVSKVYGNFSQWKATLEFDEQNPAASRVEVQIEAASVNTEQPQRDEHLSSADFFDVATHPYLTFRSTQVVAAGEGRYTLNGDLTMRGVTRPIELAVEFIGRIKHPQMGERAGFSATGTINRKDFGVSFNQVLDSGGLALSDTVALQIDIEAVKQTA